MLRRFVFVLIMTFSATGAAYAQPVACVDPTQSWKWEYSNNDPINFIHYYLSYVNWPKMIWGSSNWGDIFGPGQISQVLSTGYNSQIVHEMDNVPMPQATRFNQIGYGVSPGP